MHDQSFAWSCSDLVYIFIFLGPTPLKYDHPKNLSIYIPNLSSHITHHISHITHHTSHITHHTTHITHHTSHITHHTSHITHHTSHITQSKFTNLSSHITHNTSHITHHTSGSSSTSTSTSASTSTSTNRSPKSPAESPARHRRLEAAHRCRPGYYYCSACEVRERRRRERTARSLGAKMRTSGRRRRERKARARGRVASGCREDLGHQCNICKGHVTLLSFVAALSCAMLYLQQSLTAMRARACTSANACMRRRGATMRNKKDIAVFGTNLLKTSTPLSVRCDDHRTSH